MLVGEVKPTASEATTADAHTLAELEQQICVSAEAAVNAYNNAVYIIKQYNQVLWCLTTSLTIKTKLYFRI